MNLIPISLVAKRTQGEWHRQSQGRQKSECLELLASQPGSLFNIYIKKPQGNCDSDTTLYGCQNLS